LKFTGSSFSQRNLIKKEHEYEEKDATAVKMEVEEIHGKTEFQENAICIEPDIQVRDEDGENESKKLEFLDFNEFGEQKT
jgi:hypothetical protein